MSALKNIGAAIVATACGAIGFAAMTILAPASYSYAEESEERQQQSLENIAKGFEVGFKATAGSNAVIKRISPNAAADVILIDVQFTRKEIENAPTHAIDDFRRQIYVQQCALLDRKSVLASGVKLKIRTLRPSGSLLTSFDISAKGCAPYLKSA